MVRHMTVILIYGIIKAHGTTGLSAAVSGAPQCPAHGSCSSRQPEVQVQELLRWDTAIKTELITSELHFVISSDVRGSWMLGRNTVKSLIKDKWQILHDKVKELDLIHVTDSESLDAGATAIELKVSQRMPKFCIEIWFEDVQHRFEINV
ncbi:hypothetical protein Anapl_17461 [Anas platyrhynchos]|uniref:Uncharacterized protein n=1 Tax=Anas platyrhynchos TaxID=8839 RepID=R0LX55_ANAPL|nr:hypothetical protein Anapl_17461 [Anas platyrhynchos]